MLHLFQSSVPPHSHSARSFQRIRHHFSLRWGHHPPLFTSAYKHHFFAARSLNQCQTKRVRRCLECVSLLSNVGQGCKWMAALGYAPLTHPDNHQQSFPSPHVFFAMITHGLFCHLLAEHTTIMAAFIRWMITWPWTKQTTHSPTGKHTHTHTHKCIYLPMVETHNNWKLCSSIWMVRSARSCYAAS